MMSSSRVGLSYAIHIIFIIIHGCGNESGSTLQHEAERHVSNPKQFRGVAYQEHIDCNELIQNMMMDK